MSSIITSSELQSLAIGVNYKDYVTSDEVTDYRRELDEKYGPPLDVATLASEVGSSKGVGNKGVGNKDGQGGGGGGGGKGKKKNNNVGKNGNAKGVQQSYWSQAPKGRGTRNTMARSKGISLVAPAKPKPQKGAKVKESYDLSKIPTFHRLKFLQLAGNPRLPTLSDSVPVVNEKVVKDSDEGKKKGKKGSKKKGSKLKWETKLKWEKFPSVMWKPETREEWDDCVSEMTALCAQAALRRAIKGKSKISPPLSELYIRERIDIDEPLRGLQVRSDLSGYLQGFVLWTTFTTWTPYYLWCSTHPQSGMNNDRKTKGKKYDVDNKIGRELELQERTGDPKGQGVVWPKLAEISLVGGLGCGDILVTCALDALSSNTHYSYAVLQATPSSLSFYERYGFVRVGAVARYEGNNNGVVGYRHWTYADEKHLKKHGGPSYMMALNLKEYRDRRRREGGREGMEEAIEKLKVESKPTIKKVNLEKVDKAFGAMYSDFDHEVQAHPGFFAPAPKSRPIKPKPVVGPVKKRKRVPDIWMAVPLQETSGSKRRVNKYTVSKMDVVGRMKMERGEKDRIRREEEEEEREREKQEEKKKKLEAQLDVSVDNTQRTTSKTAAHVRSPNAIGECDV